MGHCGVHCGVQQGTKVGGQHVGQCGAEQGMMGGAACGAVWTYMCNDVHIKNGLAASSEVAFLRGNCGRQVVDQAIRTKRVLCRSIDASFVIGTGVLMR